MVHWIEYLWEAKGGLQHSFGIAPIWALFDKEQHDRGNVYGL